MLGSCSKGEPPSMPPTGNSFLDSLSDEMRSKLIPQLQRVDLPVRTSLYKAEEQPRYIHFMTSGMASVVTLMEGGDAVEMGLVGKEGFPEKLHLLGGLTGGTECFIQIPGTALR